VNFSAAMNKRHLCGGYKHSHAMMIYTRGEMRLQNVLSRFYCGCICIQ
jgi:hypothetical protein